MFARRLFLYLIGFFIGSVVVYFLFFKDQNRSFFPSAIILDSLRNQEIVIDEHMECLLKCHSIRREDLAQLLKRGDVIFSESSPRENPKKYVIEITNPEKKTVKLKFEFRPEKSKLLDVKMADESIKCPCGS